MAKEKINKKADNEINKKVYLKKSVQNNES